MTRVCISVSLCCFLSYLLLFFEYSCNLVHISPISYSKLHFVTETFTSDWVVRALLLPISKDASNRTALYLISATPLSSNAELYAAGKYKKLCVVKLSTKSFRIIAQHCTVLIRALVFEKPRLRQYPVSFFHFVCLVLSWIARAPFFFYVILFHCNSRAASCWMQSYILNYPILGWFKGSWIICSLWLSIPSPSQLSGFCCAFFVFLPFPGIWYDLVFMPKFDELPIFPSWELSIFCVFVQSWSITPNLKSIKGFHRYRWMWNHGKGFELTKG